MIIVVVPAYNEEENVGRLISDMATVLHQLLPNSAVHMAIVNDGSADQTATVAQAQMQALSAKYGQFEGQIIHHEVNKGLAEAIKTGLLYACDKANEDDIIVTMDCDNSHTPGLLVHLARKVFEGYDVVVASRFVPGARVVGLTRFREFLSWGASSLMRALFPIRGIRDYTCGFRAYRASALQTVFRKNPELISESGFSVMVDLLLKMYRYDPDLAFGEVPILLRYDWKKGASKMNVRKTVVETLSLLARRRMGRWD
jgi:dolichol-phosphate mannosyltransferase